MAHVITDTCIKDGLCMEACPSEAIGPAPGTPEFDAVPQLYINPSECLDCGGCAAACPTNSIFCIGDLPADKADAAAKNAAYYKK
ncbi:MAG: ferredoxin [Acidobacteria bacterium]|nr:MAG: ferredoxin [Acidobacteriota bacterium]